MPIFDYKARNKEGHVIEGTVEAGNVTQAADLLLADDSIIMSLRERRHVPALMHVPNLFNRIKIKDLVVFSRQLSVMVGANLALVKALRILVNQTENPRLKLIIAEVANEVDGGAALSQSLGRHPHVFNHFFFNMVRSGETSGRLDEVLNYLADQQERDYELMSKIKGAMIYPIFIVGALIIVGTIMMVVVIPKLTAVLVESGQVLPFATRALIGVSGFLASFWWVIAVVGAAGFVVVKIALERYAAFRHLWDFLKLKVPVFGSLLQRIYLVRFTRSLGTLMQGGVPLPAGLEIVSDIVGNTVYRGLIVQTMHEVEDGHSLTSVFVTSKEVPAMMTNMLSAGEETGKIETILARLTDFYSREIDHLVANLVSLIEPAIMIVLGLAIGIIVAAIILPMYNLSSGF